MSIDKYQQNRDGQLFRVNNPHQHPQMTLSSTGKFSFAQKLVMSLCTKFNKRQIKSFALERWHLYPTIQKNTKSCTKFERNNSETNLKVLQCYSVGAIHNMCFEVVPSLETKKIESTDILHITLSMQHQVLVVFKP